MPRVSDHQYDPISEFCIRCGCHRETVFVEQVECIGQPGVIPITHLRFHQQLQDPRPDLKELMKRGLHRPTPRPLTPSKQLELNNAVATLKQKWDHLIGPHNAG